MKDDLGMLRSGWVDGWDVEKIGDADGGEGERGKREILH